MGMAVSRPYTKPKPMARNLIVCDGCGAQYDPRSRWLYGYSERGSTSDDFHAIGRVPQGNCPVCDHTPDVHGVVTS